MKKLLKNTMIAILIALSLGVSPKKSYAGAVEAPAEMIGVLAMYIQKISKTALYIETIIESVTYVTSIGKEGVNAAVKGLMSMAGSLSSFQSVLHFSDSGQFASLFGDVGNSGSMGELLDVDIDGQAVGEMVGKTAAGAWSQTTGADGLTKIVAGVAAKEVGGAIGNALDGDDKKGASGGGSPVAQVGSSAYEKMGTVQKSYGQPQDSKQAAEKHIKSLFFYSTKEGDKYEGAELSETDKAIETAMQNRRNYQKEIIAMSYATAVENRTTVYEQSLKRLEQIKQKADSAETADDKKAVEAMITQEETRLRMNRLSVELAILESDVVEDLMDEPADILIARTAEQIRQDTQEKLDDVNFDDNELSDYRDAIMDAALGGQS